MYKNAKSYEKSMMAASLFTAILGLILLILPGISIKIITIAIALTIMVLGGVLLGMHFKLTSEEKLIDPLLVLSITLLALGLFLFINNESLANFITTVLGVFISIKSLFKIQFAINIRKISDKWKYNLVIGLLSLTLGVLILLNPFSSATLFLRIIGIILFIGSLIEIVETYLVLKNMKSNDNTIEANFVEKSNTYEK